MLWDLEPEMMKKDGNRFEYSKLFDVFLDDSAIWHVAWQGTYHFY